MLYNITKSQIDNQGYQYICGMLEEPKFNDEGLWHGIKAFDVLLNHRRQTSTISTFEWINGVACNFKIVKRIKGEVFDVSEIQRLIYEVLLSNAE